MSTGCDYCGAPVVFRAYASYNADHGENSHPLHARYPMPMIRSCAEHLGESMAADVGFGATNQWIVVMPTCSADELDEAQQ